LRKERGWLQIDLAEHTGLTPTYISEIEKARRDIQFDTLGKLADGFEIDLGEMLLHLHQEEEVPKASRHGKRKPKPSNY
jgi:transcriptional regulator with XRE-family HTH domain